MRENTITERGLADVSGACFGGRFRSGRGAFALLLVDRFPEHSQVGLQGTEEPKRVCQRMSRCPFSTCEI
jgi:hypothetical protein